MDLNNSNNNNCSAWNATVAHAWILEWRSRSIDSNTLTGTTISLLLTLLLLLRQRTKRNDSHKASSLQLQILERKRDFLRRSKDFYGYASSPAGHIDTWRPLELPSLLSPVQQSSNVATFSNTKDTDETEVYLDYAAAALPWKSQLQQLIAQNGVLANPHSLAGPAAARTNGQIQQVQQHILQFLDAGPKQTGHAGFHPGYDIVFTSGATEALRIVAEHFAWQPTSILAYPQAVHTSVLGMRQRALAQGARFVCLPHDQLPSSDCMDEWIHAISKQTATNHAMDDTNNTGAEPTLTNESSRISTPKNLLVVPLECNFGGTRYPVPKNNTNNCKNNNTNNNWAVCLDIAKAAATGPVSLHNLQPDLAVLSFYKLFGVPTGLGALLIKKTSRHLLLSQHNNQQRLYFGGGSVQSVLAGADFVQPNNSLTQGTCHYHGICALKYGFQTLDQVGGMHAIRKHSVTLARELVCRLTQLRHSGTENPVIQLYGAWAEYDTTLSLESTPLDLLPGPTVAFNVLQNNNGPTVVGYHEVAKLAALQNPPIQLRVGCVCNPGACQQALGWTNDELMHNFQHEGHVCGGSVDTIQDRPTGVVRVSFGKDSTWEDLDALVTFLERIYVAQPESPRRKSQEHDNKVDNGPTRVILSELYVFPIKSCAAQRVSKWEMNTRTGRLWMDREFALVDSSGTAMRLQAYPQMAFIQPSIDPVTRIMTLSAPGQCSISLSLNDNDWYEPSFSTNGQAEAISPVNVCGNRCGGVLWGDAAAAEWFSDYLGVQCWLARHRRPQDNNSQERPNSAAAIHTNNASRSSRGGVAYANEQPLLLISEHAVDSLNDVLTAQGHGGRVSSRHFRPNLVVRKLSSTANPEALQSRHVEDEWKQLSIHSEDTDNPNLQLDVTGPCARCSMVDVDPTSGSKGKTLRALAEYRRQNGQITFGIFLRARMNHWDSSTDTDLSSSSEASSSCHLVVRQGDVLNCN